MTRGTQVRPPGTDVLRVRSHFRLRDPHSRSGSQSASRKLRCLQPPGSGQLWMPYYLQSPARHPGQMGRRVLVRTDASHGCGPRRSFQSRTCRRLSSSQHRQQTQGLGSRRNPVARLPRGAPVIMLKHLLHPSLSCSPVSVNACRLDRAGVPRHASNTHVRVSRAQVS